jgi:hypothetical protein
MTSCKNTFQHIGYISKLENLDSMRKIVERLPFSLKLKWRETVDSIMQREKRNATLKDIAEFIETRARVTNHPIFGKITSDTKRFDPPSYKRQYHQNARKLTILHYATRDVYVPPSTETSTKGREISCPSCNVNHWLFQCDKFKGMSVDERDTDLFERKSFV